MLIQLCVDVSEILVHLCREAPEVGKGVGARGPWAWVGGQVGPWIREGVGSFKDDLQNTVLQRI